MAMMVGPAPLIATPEAPAPMADFLTEKNMGILFERTGSTIASAIPLPIASMSDEVIPAIN
jgi:hypothetical protein